MRKKILTGLIILKTITLGILLMFAGLVIGHLIVFASITLANLYFSKTILR